MLDNNAIQGLGNDILSQLMEKNRTDFIKSNCSSEIPDDSYLCPEDEKKVITERVKRRLTLGDIWIHVDFESLQDGLVDLYTLDGYFSLSAYGFALRKNWKLAEQVKDIFVHYGSSGTFDKITRKYRKINKRDKHITVSQSFNVKGFFPVILIMLAFGLSADILMIAAYLWQNTKKNTIEAHE